MVSNLLVKSKILLVLGLLEIVVILIMNMSFNRGGVESEI